MAERAVVLAPTVDPALNCHLEDVLAVYERPYDPARRVVCLDETRREFLGNARPPRPAAP